MMRLSLERAARVSLEKKDIVSRSGPIQYMRMEYAKEQVEQVEAKKYKVYIGEGRGQSNAS